MANRFFTNLINLIPFTKIRSSDVEQDFSAVAAGFDLAQVEIDASLRAPDGETLTRLPAAAARANKSFVFDASGNPTVTVQASSSEMAAAVDAAVAADVSAAAAAASAATLAGSTNAIHVLQLQAGVI